MMLLLRTIVFGWTVLVLTGPSQSTETARATIEFTADKSTAQIAEPIELKVVARVPLGWQIRLPTSLELPDAMSLIAIGPVAMEAEPVAEDMQVIVRHYEVEAYSPGLHAIALNSIPCYPPAGAWDDTTSDDTGVPLQAEPVNIRVQSALGLFESANQLRPIADTMPVPWSAGQWVAWLGVLAAVVGSALVAQRWLVAHLNRSLPGQRGLKQRLIHVDRQRLHGQLSHGQTVLQFADLLRKSLQLASGNDRRFRTTAEWIRHCRLHYDDGTTSGTQRVLLLADAIKFSDRTVTLDDVRESLATTRQVLSRLEQSTPLHSGREGDA